MKILRSALLLLACLALSGKGLVAQQIRLDAGTKLLVPSSAHTDKFTSFLAVVNLGSQANNITITARRTNGSIIGSPINHTLNVGGKFRSTDILGEMGAQIGDFGPITIVSSNNQEFCAVSEVTSVQGFAGFFPGVNVQSAWMEGFIPEVIDTAAFRTNLGLNTIDATPANVTLTLHDDSGNILGSANVQVPGNGMNQISPLTSAIPALSGTNAYLQIKSDRPIHAWASKINNGTNDPSFEIGVAALTSGSVSQIAPAISDIRNNLLFIGLALIVPFALVLRRHRVIPPTGADQLAWAMETL